MREEILYKHQPFSNEDTNTAPIRLLYLQAGANNDQLIGEIHHARLDVLEQIPTYEALSYCWGNVSEVSRITIGSDGYLPLTYNLSNAIHCLRLAKDTRILWIDAICINQNDADERSREVQLMHRVFHHAQRVLVWIDEPIEKSRYWNTKLAFNMATMLAELHELHPEIDVHRLGRIRKAIARHRNGFSRSKMGQIYLRPADALRSLFTRPWFERMWVVQEVSCSTHAVALCGDNQIDFRVLIQGFEFGLRSGLIASYRQRTIFFPRQVAAPATNVSAAIAIYKLTNQNLVEDDLFILLKRFHGSKCADPRDKLFALYGIASLDHMNTLSSNLEDIGILPNYHLDAAELYIKVARGIIRTSQNLDLLSVPHGSVESDDPVPNLPSWVPDWSSLNKDAASISSTVSNHYSASADSKHTLETIEEENTTTTNQTITISGYFLDRIVEVGVRAKKSFISLFNEPGAAYPPVRILVTFLLWIEQAVEWEFKYSQHSKTGAYINGEDMVNVYWHILLAARNQFETQWYIDQHLNHDIRPSRLSQWCAQQIDKLPRFRTRHFKLSYYTMIYLIMYTRGLRRFGLYDSAIIRNRTIARTEQGYIGFVPTQARPGDSIAICQGGKMPLVIRLNDATNISHELILVGDAYIHGIMHGEAWNEARCSPINLS